MHHWNHRQQLLSVLLHAKHQLLKELNEFCTNLEDGRFIQCLSAGKLILQRLLLWKSPLLFLWSMKGKCKRAGRGSAAWEVQEIRGERLFRNAVFTFLSHCWKLTEEWMHWWASRNLSWAFKSQVKLFRLQVILNHVSLKCNLFCWSRHLWTGIPAQHGKQGNTGAFHPLNDTSKPLSPLPLTAADFQ